MPSAVTSARSSAEDSGCSGISAEPDHTAGPGIDPIQVHLIPRCGVLDMIEQNIPVQDSRLGQGKFRFDLRSDSPICPMLRK